VTVPIVKAVASDLGPGWAPGFEVSTEFLDWILPRVLTQEQERFLYASMRATKATVAGAARIEPLTTQVRDYLARYGWPNFPERDIADAIRRFGRKPAEIVQALTAAVTGPADYRLSRELVRTWINAATSQGRNLVRDAGFRRYTGEARIDLGPVIADLAGATPADFPKLIPTALRHVQRLGDQTRAGMRDVLADALRQGRNPLDVARRLRELPGFALTRGQARAVRTYREALMEGRFGEAASRGLHDRRFTSTPETTEQLNRMVERYAERLASYRARTIARTEMMRSVNEGNRVLWQQVADKNGYEPEEVRRYWVVAPEIASTAALDSRAPAIAGPCPICKPVPAMNPRGRRMDEPFRTPEGLIDMPPLHPNCRCIIYYEPDVLAVTRRTVGALDARIEELAAQLEEVG